MPSVRADLMDYPRAYWLLFLGAGLLFAVRHYLEYAATGTLGAWTAVVAAVALLVIGVSAYAVAYPDRVGGPEEANARFAIAVGIFLLMVYLFVDQLLA